MIDEILEPGIPASLLSSSRTDVIFSLVNVCFITHQLPHGVVTELDALMDLDEASRAVKFQAIVEKMSVSAAEQRSTHTETSGDGTIIL